MIKLGELVMILDLHSQGLSVSAIARQVGVDRKIVRTYIAKGLEPPAYKKRPPAPSLVDRFEPYLRERLPHSLRSEACRSTRGATPRRPPGPSEARGRAAPRLAGPLWSLGKCWFLQTRATVEAQVLTSRAASSRSL